MHWPHGNSQGYPQVITKNHFSLKQMPRQKFPQDIYKALGNLSKELQY